MRACRRAGGAPAQPSPRGAGSRVAEVLDERRDEVALAARVQDVGPHLGHVASPDLRDRSVARRPLCLVVDDGVPLRGPRRDTRHRFRGVGLLVGVNGVVARRERRIPAGMRVPADGLDAGRCREMQGDEDTARVLRWFFEPVDQALICPRRRSSDGEIASFVDSEAASLVGR